MIADADNVFETLQNEIAAEIASKALFQDIELPDGTPWRVLTEDEGDVEYMFEHMISACGLSVIVQSPTAHTASGTKPVPEVQFDPLSVAVSISASNIIVADMTIGNVGYHGVQVRGEKGVHRVVLHNLQVQDTGQQLVKGSVGNNGQFSESVLVACSSFEYADHAPSDYTNGVDVLGGRRWTVRDNRFRNIRGPQERNYAAGPAILFWRDCRDTLIAGNIVVDCFRGISLGLVPAGTNPAASGETYYDHQRGMVCNNVVCNLQPWGDEGIEANAAKDARIEHNTVLVEGTLPWSIFSAQPLLMTLAASQSVITIRSQPVADPAWNCGWIVA
jgi:hypothetical protein